MHLLPPLSKPANWFLLTGAPELPSHSTSSSTWGCSCLCFPTCFIEKAIEANAPTPFTGVNPSWSYKILWGPFFCCKEFILLWLHHNRSCCCHIAVTVLLSPPCSAISYFSSSATNDSAVEFRYVPIPEPGSAAVNVVKPVI